MHCLSTITRRKDALPGRARGQNLRVPGSDFSRSRANSGREKVIFACLTQSVLVAGLILRTPHVARTHLLQTMSKPLGASTGGGSSSSGSLRPCGSRNSRVWYVLLDERFHQEVKTQVPVNIRRDCNVDINYPVCVHNTV